MKRSYVSISPGLLASKCGFLARQIKLVFVGCFAAVMLASCGGGGGAGPVTSTLSFPMKSGMAAAVQQGGGSTDFSVSGSCSGTANITSSTPTPATFETVTGLSVLSTLSMNLPNCSTPYIYGTVTDYYDSNYIPLGTIDSSSNYGVYTTPPNIPVSVKVGDAGTIGTKKYYTDDTKTFLVSRDESSYVIEPDTADTAIVNMIGKSYDPSGTLISTEQDRSRIKADGSLTFVSADLQYANGSKTHLVMTALPDTAPPAVLSTNPPNYSKSVPVYSSITAAFSEAIDPATVTAASFTLMDGTTPVPGTVTYSGTTATFTPTAPLISNTAYTATISNGVKDLSGNALLDNYSWKFTVAAPLPQPGLVTSPDPLTTLQPTALPMLNATVAYQVDPAHSGHATFGQPLTFPAGPAWSIDFGNELAYPLVAEGKVFVLTKGPVAGSNPAYGGLLLYALDLQTGNVLWGPVGIPGIYYAVGHHAYDNGRVFVMDYDGNLRAFDAATGTPLWTDNLAHTVLDGKSIDGTGSDRTEADFFSAAPTATHGIVYVSGAAVGGILFAVDGVTGNIIWEAPVREGDHSAATVTNEGVFVSYPCQVEKLDPANGNLQWYYYGQCFGGGGFTTAYANGQLYVRDWLMPLNYPGLIFDTTSGEPVGYFPTRPSPTPIPTPPMPAIDSQFGYFVYGAPTGCCTAGSGSVLGAIDLTSGNLLWEFSGDGNIAMAPVVVDDYVFSASQSGKLYAVNRNTGTLVWTGDSGSTLFGTDEWDDGFLTGIAAGQGYVVLPAGNRLTAWRMIP